MDSHGRRCGMVELHDSAYVEKRNAAVKILVLSDGQPNDVMIIKNIPLDYPVDDHEEESQTSHSSDIPKRYPVTPLSKHKRATETDWLTSTHFNFYAFYAEKDRIALMGGEGPLGGHHVGSVDGRAEDVEVRSINERIGLGLVHVTAMHWALEPGPRMEDVWLM